MWNPCRYLLFLSSTLLLSCLLTLGSAIASLADGDPLQARMGGALALGESLAVQEQELRASDGVSRRPVGLTARLELPGDAWRDLQLPVTSHLSDLVAVEQGWLLAATSEAADGRRHLLLLGAPERQADSVELRLPVPGDQRAALRWQPVVLTEADGSLAGLAWLEGDGLRSLAVRVAEFEGSTPWSDGAAWSAPRDVAPAGAGSQLALAGAVLTDGSWLLVWSGFDGEDDEILFAHRSPDGAWSGPRVLRLPGEGDNQVPDITPAVTALADGGAIVAWSRFHREPGGTSSYRLHRAVLDETVHEPALLDAGSLDAQSTANTAESAVNRSHWNRLHWRSIGIEDVGTGFPRFLSGGAQPQLLFQTAWPRSWTLLELDGEGREVRRARGAAGAQAVPVIEMDRAPGRDTLRWRWPEGGRSRVEVVTWEAVTGHEGTGQKDTGQEGTVEDEQ